VYLPFKNGTEFNTFIKESYERGDLDKDLDKFNRMIRVGGGWEDWEDIMDSKNWDWIEKDTIYLAANTKGGVYYIYAHPGWSWSDNFSDTIWYCYNPPTSPDGAHDFSDRGYWIDKYLKLSNHLQPLYDEYSKESMFLNWINENPFEVKQ